MGKHRDAGSIETVQTQWTDLVLVCVHCAEGRGFGEKGRSSLAAVLKGELRDRGLRRRIGIAEVECLGVCPKRGVTAGLARRPELLLIVPVGETPGAVLARLGVSNGA